MKTLTKTWLLFFCVLSLAYIGCRRESRPEGFPELVSVKLYLSQDGQPLEGADVNLENTETDTRWTAGGGTDSSGFCQLYTHGRYKGVPRGTFKVTVTKVVTNATETQGSATESSRAKAPGEFDTVDPVYGDVKTTPLIMEIREKNEEFRLDVGKPVRVRKKLV